MEGSRAARQAELNQVLALVNKVFRSGVDQEMSTDYPLVFDPSNLGNLRVVLEDGRIVSHAATADRELRENGCVLPISMICAVATNPDYRKRGAATRIMEDAVSVMADRGKAFGLLWTGPARDFYRRLGWEVVGSNGWTYLLEPDDAGRFDQPFGVRAYRADSDLRTIMEIHEAQPRRVSRTEAEYRALFGLPKTKVWVAGEGGAPEGYLVVTLAYNKSGVVEWGGSSRALSSLLAHVLSDVGDERIQVFVPVSDNPMTDLLAGQGCETRIPMEVASGCGLKMVRILSLRNLLQQMSPYLKNHLAPSSGRVGLVVSETGERVSLKWDAAHLEIGSDRLSGEQELSLRQAARLVFGPEKPSIVINLPEESAPGLDRALPFLFHIWMLDYV